MTGEKIPVIVYAESTPNPASMKFVANTWLLEEGSVEYVSRELAVNCPLALQLFEFTGVSSVFIAGNFVTITKKPDIEWFEIQTFFREFIKGFLESGEKIFTGDREQKSDPAIERTTTASSIETKIVETLEEYVRPAVEQDGGAIHFKSFENGIVTLILKGSCSGCPSSTQTLKGGIENLLKRLIPEVQEVVAEAQ
ncbi:MAG: NifU family protein [Bacteroidetes bacterium]|nr:NifU family protein [Bacteroidota bacterium]